jgi:hypothetical protein
MTAASRAVQQREAVAAAASQGAQGFEKADAAGAAYEARVEEENLRLMDASEMLDFAIAQVRDPPLAPHPPAAASSGCEHSRETRCGDSWGGTGRLYHLGGRDGALAQGADAAPSDRGRAGRVATPRLRQGRRCAPKVVRAYLRGGGRWTGSSRGPADCARRGQSARGAAPGAPSPAYRASG